MQGGSPIWAVNRCELEIRRCFLIITEIRIGIASSSKGKIHFFLTFSMEETIWNMWAVHSIFRKAPNHFHISHLVEHNKGEERFWSLSVNTLGKTPTELFSPSKMDANWLFFFFLKLFAIRGVEILNGFRQSTRIRKNLTRFKMLLDTFREKMWLGCLCQRRKKDVKVPEFSMAVPTPGS